MRSTDTALICQCLAAPTITRSCSYVLLSLPELDIDKVGARFSFTRRRFSGLVAQKDLRNQPAVMLSKAYSYIMETVHLIHDLYRSKTIWIVDVEFHQPRGYLPVPFCLAVLPSTAHLTVQSNARQECMRLVYEQPVRFELLARFITVPPEADCTSSSSCRACRDCQP